MTRESSSIFRMFVENDLDAGTYSFSGSDLIVNFASGEDYTTTFTSGTSAINSTALLSVPALLATLL